jgi:ArsR family transcriptional regulator
MNTNMEELPLDERVSRIFRAISTPTRFRILTAIGKGEACVCHLEALLNLRQAYISQQLMEMREANVLDTRREGRYIYYRLTEPKLLDMLLQIGVLLGFPERDMDTLLNAEPAPQCACPNCVCELNPALMRETETPSH